MTSISIDTQERFAATRWSIATHVGTAEADGARNALGELSNRFRYPVYVYLRRCGHTSAAAAALTQGFLSQLTGETAPVPDGGSTAQGPYRVYLLARLRSFLAAKDRPAAMSPANDRETPDGLEDRYRREPVDAPSPEQSFQRAFALQILDRTLRRLRSEARQTGHLDMYERLEHLLAREPVSGEYEAIAAKLGSRPLVLTLALKRLRQRFRELVADELADTVASEADLASEQDVLLIELGGAQG